MSPNAHHQARAAPSPAAALAALQREHARSLAAGGSPRATAPHQRPPSPTPATGKPQAYFDLLRMQYQERQAAAPSPRRATSPRAPTVVAVACPPCTPKAEFPAGWSPFHGPQWLSTPEPVAPPPSLLPISRSNC
eukprot:EG_transcript_15338